LGNWKEALLSDSEPIIVSLARGRDGRSVNGSTASGSRQAKRTSFDRRELTQILDMYGRKVAAGEWRDYAIDSLREKAVFSVFRKSSEHPLYRIEKDTRLSRRQGAYSVIAATGLILKRGHDLKNVLRVLDRRGLRLVEA
jgi:hypothetical protein